MDAEGNHETTAPRRAVFVVGMHRSGTSALTGVLQLLGVDLGRDLMPPRPGVNDRGFFEHAPIYRVHNALLGALGSSWDDFAPLPDGWWRDERVVPFRAQLAEIVGSEFGSTPLWGLKDPRLCKTLPLWRELLSELRIELCPVLIARAPEEVVESIGKSQGVRPAKARALWLRHVADAERSTRDVRRLLVTYDQLLADWRKTVARIASAFSIRWPREPDAAAPAVQAFLDPELKRCRGPNGRARDVAADALAPEVEQAWQEIVSAAEGSDRELSGRLDRLTAPFDALFASASLLVEETRSLRVAQRKTATSLTATKELAASRERDLAQKDDEISRSRSQAKTYERDMERLKDKLQRSQLSLDSARASMRRRRRLLRRTRRLAEWRLLCVWRALARRLRRLRRKKERVR